MEKYMENIKVGIGVTPMSGLPRCIICFIKMGKNMEKRRFGTKTVSYMFRSIIKMGN